MAAVAPWSVKGIEPKAREVAKELARRSGMTLGEWLNRIILEDDMPEEIASEEQITARLPRAIFETPPPVMSSSAPSPKANGRPADPAPSDDLGRIAVALDRLTDRIEASETRTGLAISGVEHSVRHAMARIETAEREQISVATRFDAAAERLEAEQARASERLRQIETEGPRSIAALTALEARMARAETAPNPAEMIEDVVARLGERLATAEARTGAALESLRGTLGELDTRLEAVGGGQRDEFEQRLEGLAGQLTRRVEDARSEIAQRLAATAGGEVEARLARLSDELASAEQRQARAIETLGREMLAMAETLSRRVRDAEQRSAEAIEQVGGEIARIAGAVETRLSRTDQLHIEALARLGAEIGNITERLTERIIQSERRAAQAIDNVGEQVAKVTERLEQRHERISSDLAERMRASEERTARLLEEARNRLDERLGLTRPRGREDFGPSGPISHESEPAVSAAAFGAELFSRAEPMSQPALDPANPAFAAEDFEAADAFVPLAEAAETRIEFEPPKVEPPNAEPGEAPLSTRQVIEQARAAAGARPTTLPAGDRRPRSARGGLFGALKPARTTSTWQTALMVAGGAAFLSVGAAGVVLMEGPSAPRQPEQTQPFIAPPRAALALTPPPAAPPAAVPAATALPTMGPAATEGPAADYLAAVRGLEHKTPGALAKLKTLAEAGHPPAQVFLARLYETGQAGVIQNLAEARRWTLRAAEAGDPAAMHNVALYYFRGEGGPQDSAAAARWFKDAAEHGVVDSQYNLGLLYQSGSGVSSSPAQAYKWFSIAARAGDAEARAAAADVQDKVPTAQLAAVTREVGAFQAVGAAPAAETPAAGPSVRSTQAILHRLGYYKGRADGAETPALKLAVAAYQRDQGLAATGSLDPATVSRLSVFNR